MDLFIYEIENWKQLVGIILFRILNCKFFQIAIIESVKSGSLLRPSIETGDCNPNIGQLMKRCWHEDPNERPDFTDIRQVMRRINK